MEQGCGDHQPSQAQETPPEKTGDSHAGKADPEKEGVVNHSGGQVPERPRDPSPQAPRTAEGKSLLHVVSPPPCHFFSAFLFLILRFSISTPSENAIAK